MRTVAFVCITSLLELMGAISLIVPEVSRQVKEWAYFVFFVNFSAFLAQYAVNDSAGKLSTPLVMVYC
jgi:uncharacterized membrane protein